MVATHPHLDHVRGLPQVLQLFGDRVAELWDPGYFHTLPDYHELMCEVERRPRLQYTQPTSGLRRYIGNAAVTVLSPRCCCAIASTRTGPRSTTPPSACESSFPAARVIQRNADRTYVKRPRTNALILGADAQTLSWSYVMTDFPYLAHSGSAAATAIGAATGGDMLRSQVLKVSHHCSKHGVNLELVERVAPHYTLVSSVGGGGKYNFPHNVAQEVVREGLQAIAGAPGRAARTGSWGSSTPAIWTTRTSSSARSAPS